MASSIPPPQLKGCMIQLQYAALLIPEKTKALFTGWWQCKRMHFLTHAREQTCACALSLWCTVFSVGCGACSAVHVCRNGQQNGKIVWARPRLHTLACKHRQAVDPGQCLVVRKHRQAADPGQYLPGHTPHQGTLRCTRQDQRTLPAPPRSWRPHV